MTARGAEGFKAWLDAAFHGPPEDARAHCQRTMKPDYQRWSAGADFTDFERAVEKVALFRSICRVWRTQIRFYMEDGPRVAARLLVDVDVGQGESRMELMFMGEKDDQGRFWKVWEQSKVYVDEDQRQTAA